MQCDGEKFYKRCGTPRLRPEPFRGWPGGFGGLALKPPKGSSIGAWRERIAGSKREGVTLFACELLELIRSGKAAKAVKTWAPVSEWVSLYRDPKRIKKAMRDGFGPAMPAEMSEVSRWIKPTSPKAKRFAEGVLKNMPDRFKTEGKRLMEDLARATYQESLVEVADIVGNIERANKVDMDALMLTPEAQFLIFVFLPGIMQYGQSPMRIYRRARRGDRVALDELLRLDKVAMYDEKIGHYVRHLGMTHDKFGTEIIAKAYQNAPDTLIDNRSIKVRHAAQIMMRADRHGYAFTYQDLLDLFDALAKDRTGDPMAHDPDLQDDIAAFKKAVQRAKPFWNMAHVRDTIAVAKCPVGFECNHLVSDSDEPETLNNSRGGGQGPGPVGGPQPPAGAAARRVHEWAEAVVGYCVGNRA